MSVYQSVNRNARVFRSLKSFPEDISHSADGLVQVALSVSIDLVAQPADSGLHNVRLGVEIVVPDMFHDHGLRYDASRVAHQVLQKGELAGAQVDSLAASDHFPGEQVHRQVGHLETGGLREPGGSPDECLHAGK